MGTYNGDKFIDKQISSIVNQLSDGKLIIHDDGSKDGTIEIIKKYSLKDDRIVLIEAPSCGGAAKNFAFLLEKTTSDYVFCSDQDDIWISGKIDKMIKIIKMYENIYGKEKPLLIHTDLELIDENDETIHKSMWRYQNLNPKWGDDLNLLLTQNVITGCALLVNRALLDIALPIPNNVVMHDHWLGLVACTSGKVIYHEESLIRYRHHGNNEVGAKKSDIFFYIDKIREVLASRSRNSDDKIGLYNQAQELSKRLDGRIKEIPQRFSNLDREGFLRRMKSIIEFRFYKFGIIKNTIWILDVSKLLYKFKRVLK